MKMRKISVLVMATLVLSSGTALAVGQPVTPITENMALKSGGVKEIIARGWRSNAHDSASWKVFNPSVILSAAIHCIFD